MGVIESRCALDLYWLNLKLSNLEHNFYRLKVGETCRINSTHVRNLHEVVIEKANNTH